MFQIRFSVSTHRFVVNLKKRKRKRPVFVASPEILNPESKVKVLYVRSMNVLGFSDDLLIVLYVKAGESEHPKCSKSGIIFESENISSGVLYTQPQAFFNASTEKNVVFTASYAI